MLLFRRQVLPATPRFFQAQTLWKQWSKGLLELKAEKMFKLIHACRRWINNMHQALPAPSLGMHQALQVPSSGVHQALPVHSLGMHRPTSLFL